MPLSTVILLAVLIADLFWRDSFRRLFGSSSNTLVEDMQQLENTLLASSTTMKSMSALESVLAATNGNDNKHVSRDDNDIMLPARQLCPNTARLFPSRTNLRAFVKGRIDYYQNGVGLQKVSAWLDKQIDRTLYITNATFHRDAQNDQFIGPDEAKKYFPSNPSIDNPDKVSSYLTTLSRKEQVSRGGYGQDLAGHFEGHNTDVLLVDRHLAGVLESTEKDKWRVVLMHELGPLCTNFTKFGNNYAAKYFCDDPNDSQKHRLGNNNDGKVEDTNECHMLSIGSNDQWEFESDVVARKPDCHIHVFDCTLSTKDGLPKKQPKSDKIHFHKYCMGMTNHAQLDGKRQYRTYQSLLDIAGLTTTPTRHNGDTTKSFTKPKYLKMDIEGFEIEIIPNMIREMDPRTLPEQIMIEVHSATKMTDIPWMLRILSVGELFNWFAVLFLAGGYLPIKLRGGFKACPICMEVLFVQVLCPEA